MKNTKILLALLLLAALTLCSCHTPSPDPVDTTPPAETTPAAQTTPLETTTTENTPADPTPQPTELSTYTGVITSPDNISLEGIKVDVYEVTGPKYGMDPSPDIIAYQKYNTDYDFSDYEYSDVYRFSVYTDAEGKFSFRLPAAGSAIRFDFNTFPEQYGIRGTDDNTAVSLYDPLQIYSNVSYTLQGTYSLEKVEKLDCSVKCLYDGFHFIPLLYNGNGDYVYGKAALSHGRFDDGFIDAMINGAETINYTATVECGNLSEESSATVLLNWLYPAWEWRVDYLYYNNYIDTAQYEEIYRAKEPTKFGPYY